MPAPTNGVGVWSTDKALSPAQAPILSSFSRDEACLCSRAGRERGDSQEVVFYGPYHSLAPKGPGFLAELFSALLTPAGGFPRLSVGVGLFLAAG